MALHQGTVQRADARRNREAVLASAARLIAAHGTEVTFEDIAADAGVGKGTLYRNFPTRDHLIAGVMQARFDALAALADELGNEHDAFASVETWLREFDRQPEGSIGLGARVADGLSDGGASAVSTACSAMKAGFTSLVERAKRDGAVRPDIDVPELLTVVATMPRSMRDAQGRSTFLNVLLRGIRT